MTPVQSQGPSAAGAPLDQVLVVIAFTIVVYTALLWVIYRERTGHPTLVGRTATRVAKLDDSPRWFTLPMAITVVGALSGAVGLYWDVSFHISEGRDDGPLANPAHYFIFLGLVAIFAGSALGMGLVKEPTELPRRTFRLSRHWVTPIGPAMGTAISLCALLGFPLDDIWHRLFGQDVTEWGPTHVLMIGGTLMLPYAILLKCAEARQVSSPRSATLWEWVGLLIVVIGPVAFLLEFAYGVPQFPLLNDPVVLTLAAVMTFVLAAMRGARWVVSVWVGYAVLHLGLVALNVWAFDALIPWPPSVVGGALVAAVLARWARPTGSFGALAAVAVTLDMLAVEYCWTQEVRPIPWPAEMMPWALLFCSATGAGVGVVAVWLHSRLRAVGDPRPDAGTGRAGRLPRAALAGALAVLAVFVVNVPPEVDRHGSVDVAFDPVAQRIAGAEAAYVEVEVDPGTVADAYWFEALAWQGGGAVHGELEQVAPGRFRTDEPMPLSGSWKTLVRLHTPLHSLVAAPVYLPADPAIPAPEVPAVAGARELVEESHILRREEKPNVPGWLWGTAYAVVGGLFLLLFVLVAVGYSVAARRGDDPSDVHSRPPGDRVAPDTRDQAGRVHV
jgi:hypothetical protein